jgi:hypothetical protein
MIAIAAALAAVLVLGAVTRGTWALFTASPASSSGNTFAVDSLGSHFQVTPGSAVQPGTSTPIASGNVDTLALAVGTVPSARTITSVFTVKNIGSSSATATLSLSSVAQISSAVFASSGTSSATLAAGASTTVSLTTSSTTAGHGAGALRLTLSGSSWMYRDYSTTIDEAPEAPASLTATAHAGKISLSWGASTTTTNLAGYNVYRSTGGSYTQLNGSAVSGTTYDDTTGVNGTTYTYKVRAVSTGAALESLDSPTSSAKAYGALAYSATGAPVSRTSSGAMTVNYPAGTSPNDLMLLVEINNANQNITTPSGWTLLADQATNSPSQFRMTIWWKLAAAESSVALTVNANASGATAWAIRYARPGGYPPNPATATATVRQGLSGASSTMTPGTNLTTNQPEARVLSIVAIRGANTLTLNTAQGFSLENATTGTSRALGVADLYVATSGTTPASPTWSQSGTAAQWAWATVAFG